MNQHGEKSVLASALMSEACCSHTLGVFCGSHVPYCLQYV